MIFALNFTQPDFWANSFIGIECALYYQLYFKSCCFWRNLHRWQKLYTAAGSDGMDKFHLCYYTIWIVIPDTTKEAGSDHQSENKKLQMNCIYSWTWQLGQLKSVQGLKWKQPSLSNVKPLRAWLNQLAGSADVCTTICWFTPHFLRHFNFTAMAAMSGITPWGKTQKKLRISGVTPPPLRSFLNEKTSSRN